MADNKTLYVIDLKDAFSPKIDKAGQKFDRFDRGVKGAVKPGGGIGGLLGAMNPLAMGVAGVVAGIGLLATKIIGAGKEAEQTRIAFSVMFGGQEEGNKMLDLLNEFANVTPFTNDQVIKAGKTLKAFGMEAKEILPTLKILGDVSAGTGKDVGEMAVIFGKIKANSKLMGAELNMLVDAGFNPLQKMADRTGESYSSLFKKMSLGQISFEMIREEFVRATSEGGMFNDMMKKQSESFGGLVSTLKGKIGMMMATTGEGVVNALKPMLSWAIRMVDLLPSLNFTPIVDAFNDWWVAIKEVLSPIGELFDMLFEGTSELSTMQIVVNSIATAFRLASFPIKLFSQSLKSLFDLAMGGGEFLIGILTGDASKIASGITGLQNAWGGMKDLFVDEGKAFAKIWATEAKEEAKKVDLAGAMDLSNLGGAGGGGAGGAGGAGGTTSKTSGRVAGISSGGIKNVTLNITKLVENINMTTGNAAQDMARLKDQVTRILVEAATDATRIIGQ